MPSALKSAIKRKPLRSNPPPASEPRSVVPGPKVGSDRPEPPPGVNPVDAYGVPDIAPRARAAAPRREGSPHPSPGSKPGAKQSTTEYKRDDASSSKEKPANSSKLPVKALSRLGLVYGWGQELNVKESAPIERSSRKPSQSKTGKEPGPTKLPVRAPSQSTKGKEPVRYPAASSGPSGRGRAPTIEQHAAQMVPAMVFTPPSEAASAASSEPLVSATLFKPANKAGLKPAPTTSAAAAGPTAAPSRLDREETEAFAVEAELMVQAIRRELKLASIGQSTTVRAAEHAQRSRLASPARRRRPIDSHAPVARAAAPAAQGPLPEGLYRVADAAASRDHLRDRLSVISQISLAQPGELSEADLTRTLTEAEACLAEARKIIRDLS